MRTANRLAVIGLSAAAAFFIGSFVLAVPASASAGTTAVVAFASGDTWKGGAARDLETGTWRATITRGDTTILLGHYDTEKEAKQAARKEARELNGVMDGPGCDPPFVLC
jgi:hypothetical protein